MRPSAPLGSNYNNETTGATTALGTINLHKCAQLVKTGLLICIPNLDRCLRTSHTHLCCISAEQKLGHTTQTKNSLHCKINSLALWRLARICDPLSKNPTLPAIIEFDLEVILSVQVVSQLNSDYCTNVSQGAFTVSY